MAANPLRDHLVSAASETARSALDGFDTRESRAALTVFLETGLALEFLLRSVVANVSPTLLFAPRALGDRKAYAAMMRAHRDAVVDATWLIAQKSAEMSFVRALAAEALPGLADYSAQIDLVMGRRNAVAHMWIGDVSHLRPTLTSFVRIAGLIHEHLAVTPERFWGRERLSLVNTLVDESVETVRADVELKLRSAHLHVRNLVGSLTEEEASAVLRRIEGAGNPFVAPNCAVVRCECPACGYQAELWVRAVDLIEDPDDLELVDADENNVPTAVLIPQEATAVRLECPVCFLSLTNAELDALYPEISDLESFDLEPRKGTIQEYDEILWPYEPEGDRYPHGPLVG